MDTDTGYCIDTLGALRSILFQRSDEQGMKKIDDLIVYLTPDRPKDPPKPQVAKPAPAAKLVPAKRSLSGAKRFKAAPKKKKKK